MPGHYIVVSCCSVQKCEHIDPVLVCCCVVGTGMNFLQLSGLVHDKQSSVQFLQQRGILHNPRICRNCNAPMHLSLRDRGGDRWRCHIRGCRSDNGLRKDTWLAGSHVPYRTVVLFIYAWSRETASI